jgi:hypothetical protein
MVTDTPFNDQDAPSVAADGSLSWRGGSSSPCCVEVQAADGVRTDLFGTLPVWSPDASFVVTGGAPSSWQRLAP